MNSLVKPSYLIALFIMGSMIVMAIIHNEYNLSIARATAILMLGLSVPTYIGYRLTAEPWLRRIAIACIPSAIIMWLMNISF